MEVATSLWILELSVSTSCSRLSMGSNVWSRSRTDTISSSFWRSPSGRFRFAAMRSAKCPGCSVFNAAILTWSVSARGHLGDFLKLLVRVAEHGLQLDGVLGFVPQQFVAGVQIRRGRRKRFDADAPQPLHQHAHGAVGKFHHLRQARNTADAVQIIRPRFGDFWIALQHRAEQTVADDQVIHQLEAGTGFDQQRHDGARKNHDVRQAQDRQLFRAGTGKKTAWARRIFHPCRGC